MCVCVFVYVCEFVCVCVCVSKDTSRGDGSFHFSGLGRRASAAHKPLIEIRLCAKKGSKNMDCCLGTGLDMQLNF